MTEGGRGKAEESARRFSQKTARRSRRQYDFEPVAPFDLKNSGNATISTRSRKPVHHDMSDGNGRHAESYSNRNESSGGRPMEPPPLVTAPSFIGDTTKT